MLSQEYKFNMEITYKILIIIQQHFVVPLVFQLCSFPV